jgi:D-hydroxyproline dehydrogenase subunit alpha
VAERTELAVIGAGPAGLAAAAEAAGLGLPVVLVDAYALPGGQYYRQTPPELGATAAPDGYGPQLLAAAERGDVRLLAGTSVWGLFPEAGAEASRKEGGHLLCLYGPAGVPRRLRAQAVVLAPGAYDFPFPFPGWTLPGVMTAGAALSMVKHQHLLPGHRFLLSGTGPLQLVLARHLLEAGAELAGILDANPFPWRGLWQAPAAWGQWQRLREGWDAVRTLLRVGAKIRWGQWVQRAEGDGRVERAVVGPVPGVPGAARTETVAADTICLGYGFTPAIQLSRLAGCEHRYLPAQRAYVPLRDEWLQTTIGGLYVAGDGAGIGGKDVARLEGQLAALGAARALGRDVAPEKVAALRRDLQRQRRFAALLADLFPLSVDTGSLLTDDTVLCRCEEITVAEIRRAVAEGATTVSAVRMVTRAGMGRCQGRWCSSSVAELLAGEMGRPVEAVGLATPRPPVWPVPLEGLVDDGA